MSRVFRWPGVGAALFAASLLLAWQVLADQKIISPIFFPSPMRTLGELWTQIAEGKSGSLWSRLRSECFTAGRLPRCWA